MYSILQNYSLKQYNTFGIDVKASKYVALTSLGDVELFINSSDFKNKPYLILGGGSNLLLTRDFDGIVIHPVFLGKEIVSEDCDSVYAKAFAGEKWDDFVESTVEKGFGGLENLSLIPGNVGACPIQNVGAYGVEVQDTLVRVEGFFLDTGRYFEFSNKDCHFGYRDSIFKRELRNKVLITAVTFHLRRKPELVLNYGNVSDELKKYPEINIENVRKAVISIRKSKLPDPVEIGNAGSFFKNPTIDLSLFETIKKDNPDLNGYPNATKQVKIPAAWLIDKCGWKGYRKGNVGVHQHQPLVLVNYGGANGNEIYELASQIQESVKKRFRILLEMEVNVI